MDNFSVWDQLTACLSCSRRPDIDSDDENDLERGQLQRSGRPELDGLLFDTEHDATDIEADTLSLHSNIGILPRSSSSKTKKSRRRRRTAQGKSVKVFGYDLFGRPSAPDPSPPPSDDEESSALNPSSGVPRPSGSGSTSAPLDPDAAPLPDAAIATLSSSASARPVGPAGAGTSANWAAPLTDEQIAHEEELQREKEERKARRAARRLMKQQLAAEAAADLAAGGFESPASGHGQDGAPEFEGFPGDTLALAHDAASPSAREDEYGPWQGAPQSQHTPQLEALAPAEPESDEDDIDVGGEYNRKSGRANSGSRSGGGSSSRQSRTQHSHSSSVVDGSSSYASRPRRDYHARRASMASPHNVPLPASSAGSSHGGEFSSLHPNHTGKTRPPAGYSRSSATRSLASSSTTSASTPVRSPLAQEFFPQQAVGVESPSHFGPDGEFGLNLGGEPHISSPPLPQATNPNFPTTGFSGAGKRSPYVNSQGAAFARSGW